MGLIAMLFPETISTGYGWVQKAMTGNYIGWSLIFLALGKILAMSLTISSGGSGGVFGPNVYIGGMVGAWVAFVADHLIPGINLNPAAFAVVGMAAVFAGTARVPIASLIMVAEMTGGYGLIVPSMLATTIAFVVERSISASFKYPRLYEAQVERRSDSPTHLGGMLRATCRAGARAAGRSAQCYFAAHGLSAPTRHARAHSWRSRQPTHRKHSQTLGD